MRLFNKFVESKKEPLNKNDIWFDGSVFRIYKEEGWRTITLTQEAIDHIVEYSKSLDIYVMVDELPDSGEEGKIYVLQTIIGDSSVKLEEYIWDNGWKLVDNFNSVSLVLDTELSETSHNAVANFVITEALKNKVDKSELETLCPEEVFAFPVELYEAARRVEVEVDGGGYVQITDILISKEQVESYYGCPYNEVYDKASKAKMLSFPYGSSSLTPTTAVDGTDCFFAAFSTSAGTLSIEFTFGIFKEEVDGYVFYVREWLPRLQQNTVFEELEKKANKDEIATPDWNASKNEDGFIKNKPYEIFKSRIEKVDDNTLRVSMAEDEYSGDYSVTGHYIKWSYSLYKLQYDETNLEINGGRDILYVTYDEGYYYLTHSRYDADYILSEFVDYPDSNNIFYVVKGIDATCLKDNVVKTLPQELSNDAKSQALANLGLTDIARKQELTELREAISLRNVGAEDTDESVEEPEIPIPAPSASNEWKCVVDRRLLEGEKNIIFTTYADGTPLQAKEVMVQILCDKEAAQNVTGYVGIKSTNNQTETMYGSLNYEKTSVDESNQLLQHMRICASPFFTIAEMSPDVKCTVATQTTAYYQGGNLKTFQIYEDIVYVRINANAALTSAAPYLKIYAR